MDDAGRINVDGIVREIDTWIGTALELGKEICELNEWLCRDTLNPPGWDRSKAFDINQMKAETQSRVEARRAVKAKFDSKAALFLVALNKVNRWARELQKVSPEKSAGVPRFVESFAQGKILRDIHEHDEEYRTGGGRKRDQLTYATEDGWFSADAFSTISVDGEILLGGRVSVQKMLSEAQLLRESTIAVR